MTNIIVAAGKSWSLQDQIDQLQGLMSLSVQDDKAFKAVSLKEIRDSEQKLVQLKYDVNVTRGALAKITPEDDRILKTAFRSHPYEYRVIRYKTCEQAKEYMDDKVLQLHRDLEKIRVTRQDKWSKVAQLKDNLENLMAMLGSTNVEDLRSHYRKIETEINKVKIYASVSDLIRRRYDAIIDNLKRDESCYPGLIEKLEMAAVHQSKELREIKLVCIQAQNLKHGLKENLSSMESEMHKIKSERERLIKKLRKDADKRSDTEFKKPPRPAEDYGDITETLMQREADNQLLEHYKKKIDILLEAAKVSDLKLFLTSWKKLLNASSHLQEQLEAKETMKMKLENDMKNHEEQLEHLRYTDENPDPKGLLMTELTEEIKSTEQQLWVTNRIKHEVGSLVQDIKQGLESLVERMLSVELLPKYQYYTSGDPMIDALAHCIAVCQQAMDMAEENGGEEALQEVILTISTKPEDMVQIDKIKIPIMAKYMDEEYDLEDADVAYGLNREQIKALGQALIDANTKKKRKKAKRGRRR